MLPPAEILRVYPEMKKYWTAGDIGYLLHLKLVSGKKLIRSCLIDEKDVEKIFHLVKKLPTP